MEKRKETDKEKIEAPTVIRVDEAEDKDRRRKGQEIEAVESSLSLNHDIKIRKKVEKERINQRIKIVIGVEVVTIDAVITELHD
jgi:hypothetical protein